jgi:4-hydroxybenzoyl-CoA thioesterase
MEAVMPFRAQMKVCFGDIDYAGIVYYPRFLHYFHVTLEEFFAKEIGIDYPTILEKHRLGFPTVHLQTDFREPLRYGDVIEIEIRVVHVGKTSIRWAYRARRTSDAKLMVEGENVTVSLDMDSFEKRDTPEWLKKELVGYQQRCCKTQLPQVHS